VILFVEIGSGDEVVNFVGKPIQGATGTGLERASTRSIFAAENRPSHSHLHHRWLALVEIVRFASARSGLNHKP